MMVQQLLNYKSIDTVWSVRSMSNVYDALVMMNDKNIGAVLVIDDDHLVGIFSERDYARKGILQGRASQQTYIFEVMTKKVITVTPQDKIEYCMKLMSEGHFRHLPVVQEDTVVGVISITDILDAIIREQKARISSLESYITGTPL
ncbi:CBS domain-containing protein [Cytophagaceae bacterium DM2B3-1]|uniref:CBS domain-containing protein n=1 Tax=Xanthocytophaga flava TaxID=3048013 RepID=A0ABT7CHH2_9BACT|nr:CBS domain-containing protein [Xanthocytophaga flavus]MDJ1466505.1 CBS domain-containing protein [Xanthocytophaga flavus]MDJ1492502.1 CBS domain-containing protein [Xanthocytophaga flavus]